MRDLLFVLALSVGACASAPLDAPVAGAARPEVEEDHLQLALEASGYAPAEIPAAREKFDQLVAPWTRDLAGIRFADKKARALLSRLHGPNSPLRTYDPRATSLRDVFEHGRFNCVAASVIYNLAAERIGVDARGELLPTHARSLVRVPGLPDAITVETTSPAGFDPPPQVSRDILAQVATGLGDGEARALVPVGGVQVSTRVLIAAIFVNRASLEQEGGDIEAAARLFEKGEALAPEAGMQSVLRDQRVALISYLAAQDALSGEHARIDRSVRTLSASRTLEPSDGEIRRLVARNFRVVVERYVARLASEGRDAEALERFEKLIEASALRDDRAAIRAFTLGEVARARNGRGEVDAALAAMDAALAEPLGAREIALRTTLEHNHWQLLRRALVGAAKAGDEAQISKLLDRAERVVDRAEGRRSELEKDRRVALSLLGQQKLTAGDAKGAAQVLRDAVRRFAADPTLRHNLLVALQRLWVPLAEAGRCEEAEAMWEEARSVEPSSPLPSESRARCYLVKAAQYVEARDYEEAASWLGLAAVENKDMKSIDENLGVVLLRWAQASPAACPRIAERAQQILGRTPTAATRARAESVLATCYATRK